MKRISDQFFRLLRRPHTKLARLWKITRRDGLVLAFTDHDKAITYDGVDYEPTTAFSASAMQSRADGSVDNMNVVAITSDLITEIDLRTGKLDGAKVEIYGVNWDNIGAGVMELKSGRLGEVSIKDNSFETELRSFAQSLQQPFGETYTIECRHLLGDGGCKVNTAPFTTTGVVSGVADRRIFSDRTRTEPEEWFQYGLLTWTSGANEGFSMEVVAFKGDPIRRIVLLEPMPFRIAPGDTYEIVAGCDKTYATCRGKFSNGVNFGGFPDFPDEKTVLELPRAK